MKERIWISYGKRQTPKIQTHSKQERVAEDGETSKTTMKDLASWNVSKALDINLQIDFKTAIIEVRDRLSAEQSPHMSLLPESPSQRYLACAVMAWQQHGYSDVDGLINMAEQVQMQRKARDSNDTETLTKEKTSAPIETTIIYDHDVISPLGSTYQVNIEHKTRDSVFTTKHAKYGYAGPVVALPAHTHCAPTDPDTCSTNASTKKKIDMACCHEAKCAKVMAAAEASTIELRARISRLMQRERERAELLERAELAWKQLELSYQRRLLFASQKEQEITAQTKKTIEERQALKQASTDLVAKLKIMSEEAENDRAKLNEKEKMICEMACERHKISEESARLDAELVDEQCKTTQLERNLQYNEEQARQKLAAIVGQMDSARMFTLEAEHATRGELSEVTEQLTEVTKQIKNVDEQVEKELKQKRDALTDEKDLQIEQLENCTMVCSKKINKQAEEIRTLRDKLEDIHNKIIECHCKFPTDEAVQVKRTPSVAALCHCKPEDRFKGSCSCISLRTKVLFDFLDDLFGGLHSEMQDTGARMPCQMLKCLDDKHSWDRASPLKTNLSSYFSNLLVNELDIAVATSIENYHAKWVGMSCADDSPRKGRNSPNSEERQARALEKRAQFLACEMAEKMCNKRKHELPDNSSSKDSETPQQTQQALYITELTRDRNVTSRATQEQRSNRGSQKTSSKPPLSSQWNQFQDDVTRLRTQVERLIKGLDQENPARKTSNKEGKRSAAVKDVCAAKIKVNRASNFNQNIIKSSTTRKRPPYPKICKHYGTQYEQPPKPYVKRVTDHIYPFKIMKQTYDVNLCLCGDQNAADSKQEEKIRFNDPLLQETEKCKPAKDILLDVVNLTEKFPEPQATSVKDKEALENNVSTILDTSLCPNICFHTVPSGNSIENFLKSIAQFNCNLNTGTDANNSKELNSRPLGENKSCPVPKKASYDKKQKNILNDTHENKNNSSPSKHCNKQLINVVNAAVDRNTSKSTIAVAEMILQGVEKPYGNSLTKIYPSFDNNNNNDDDNINPRKMHNKTNRDQIESHQSFFKSVLPIESEYMGAVNLEKSQAYNFHCVGKPDRKCKTFKRKCSLKYGIKCINSDICRCQYGFIGRKKKKKRITISNIANLTDHESQTKTKDETKEDKFFDDPFVLPQRVSGNMQIFANEELLKSKQTNHEKLSNITSKDIIKHSQLFPQSTDYDVVFLGVTLNTPNSKHQIFRTHDTLISKHIDVTKEKNPPMCLTDFIIGDSYHYGDTNKQSKNTKTNSGKTYIENHDKHLDIQSLRASIGALKPDQCVCCEPTEESRELELNTFELLKQHLKKRLNEFKKSTCRSSCIPQQLQEELCSTILQKVKEVISDSTNNMTCRCMDSEQSGGSWTRAYTLLQEYLRNKIKRVQCVCVTDNDLKHNNLLPDILDKVNLMIEKDFNSLKYLCQCNKIKENLVTTFEIPEQDRSAIITQKNTSVSLNLVKDLECKLSFGENTNEVIKSSKQVSNGSLRQNMSVQVSKKSMENKYCERAYLQEMKLNLGSFPINNKENLSGLEIEKFDSNEDLKNNSSEIKELVYSFSTETVNIENSGVDDNLNLLSYVPSARHMQKIIELPQAVVCQIVSGVSDGPYETQNTPLIGTTINCSCDVSLGPCVCSKAIIEGNNDEIKNMWNHFTAGSKDQAVKTAYTYIMDNIKSDNTDNTDDTCLQSEIDNILCEHFQDQCKHDKEVQSDHVDYMKLKDPDELNKCQKINNSTNMLSEGLDHACHEDNKIKHAVHNDNIIAKDPLSFPAKYKKTDRDSPPSEHSEHSLDVASTLHPANCDCPVVPICHVQMLIDNIEHSLNNSVCTCDLLNKSVCPEHSKVN